MAWQYFKSHLINFERAVYNFGQYAEADIMNWTTMNYLFVVIIQL